MNENKTNINWLVCIYDDIFYFDTNNVFDTWY